MVCVECNRVQVYLDDKRIRDVTLLGEKWEAADTLLREAEKRDGERK